MQNEIALPQSHRNTIVVICDSLKTKFEFCSVDHQNFHFWGTMKNQFFKEHD